MTTTEWAKRATKVDPILVVAAERGIATRLTEMLRGLGPVPQVMWSGNEGEAWRFMEAMHPKLIFMEQQNRDIDGLALVTRLRHSPFPGRQAPVIMISDEATVGSMRAAQSAGAHEFLIRPFSAIDLSRRLEAVCTVPRDWIEAKAYIGPDRRRFNSAAKGPERRGRSKAQPST